MNAQQNTEAALPLLSHLLDAAEAAGRRGSAIKILALQALALAERGDTRQSLSVLERALSLAAPEGYVRAFVDEGRSMAHLLSQVQTAPQGTWPDYVDRLLAAFDQSTATAPVAQALIEPLTERELEVLRLIAAGRPLLPHGLIGLLPVAAIPLVFVLRLALGKRRWLPWLLPALNMVLIIGAMATGFLPAA